VGLAAVVVAGEEAEIVAAAVVAAANTKILTRKKAQAPGLRLSFTVELNLNKLD
jgi:hypothetical protein